jgi:hypothetical protein
MLLAVLKTTTNTTSGEVSVVMASRRKSFWSFGFAGEGDAARKANEGATRTKDASSSSLV